MHSNFPLARKHQVVAQAVDDELIVYDSTQAQANLLNRTAAVVYGLCDGKTDVSELAQKASADLGAPVDEALVWYTLDQLSKKNLLQERAALPVSFARLTRRDFLRAGMAGAAVAVPVIVTIAAPSVSQAASCIQSGQACDFNEDCCSTLCVTSSCA
jgi:hypothetical protein